MPRSHGRRLAPYIGPESYWCVCGRVFGNDGDRFRQHMTYPHGYPPPNPADRCWLVFIPCFSIQIGQP